MYKFRKTNLFDSKNSNLKFVSLSSYVNNYNSSKPSINKCKINLFNRINFKFIILIVCWIGCIFQVFKLSNEFFSFETVITLKTQRQKFIEIPGITLCPTYFRELKMNARKNFTALEMFKLTRNMTQMTKDFRCWILELLIVNGTKYKGELGQS